MSRKPTDCWSLMKEREVSFTPQILPLNWLFFSYDIACNKPKIFLQTLRLCLSHDDIPLFLWGVVLQYIVNWTRLLKFRLTGLIKLFHKTLLLPPKSFYYITHILILYVRLSFYDPIEYHKKQEAGFCGSIADRGPETYENIMWKVDAAKHYEFSWGPKLLAVPLSRSVVSQIRLETGNRVIHCFSLSISYRASWRAVIGRLSNQR